MTTAIGILNFSTNKLTSKSVAVTNSCLRDEWVNAGATKRVSVPVKYYQHIDGKGWRNPMSEGQVSDGIHSPHPTY